jgi:hypothetical protein
MTMLRWEADYDLVALIRRYYQGEAGLWVEIRACIDDQLRARGVVRGAYHIRLRPAGEGYLVCIDDASGYANEG